MVTTSRRISWFTFYTHYFQGEIFFCRNSHFSIYGLASAELCTKKKTLNTTYIHLVYLTEFHDDVESAVLSVNDSVVIADYVRVPQFS